MKLSLMQTYTHSSTDIRTIAKNLLKYLRRQGQRVFQNLIEKVSENVKKSLVQKSRFNALLIPNSYSLWVTINLFAISATFSGTLWLSFDIEGCGRAGRPGRDFPYC